MQLRTNIFIWVFLATVVPLTALAFAITYYSQRDYQREVFREVTTSLTNLSAEIDRHLQGERDMVQGLLNVPAVRDVVPLLYAVQEGGQGDSTEATLARINQFFEEFHAIFPSLTSLRILDQSGNSVVKVTDGRRSPGVYESLGRLPYVEQEVGDRGFVEYLRSLPPGEIHYALLPHRRMNPDALPRLRLYDYVVPLYHRGQWVGALTVSVEGGQLDRIAAHASRLYQGELFIVEVNPEQPQRNGALLYDESRNLNIFQVRPDDYHLADVYGPKLWHALGPGPDGVVDDALPGESVYYVEMLPYPNLLLSWMLAMRVDERVVAAPFERIRWGIAGFAGFALIISLLLAKVAARTVAQPVCRLARSLKAFADGDRRVRAEPQSMDEVNALADSFNYMADTLERAREERDRAHHMLLQHAKLASIGQMAAGIGHEINNPLNNILSLSKLMKRGLPEADTRLRSDLESLRDEALRASQIVRGVLNFARQLPAEYDRFPIRPWLTETLELVRSEAEAHQVRLHCECPLQAELEADRGQLQQALINLLLNAVHASAAGQTVTLTAELDGEVLVLRVRDQGPGIDARTVDQIFDPFYTTKPVGQGSGLGLSISLGIVEYHEGTLDVVNHPEGGVEAAIRLPLTQDAATTQVTETEGTYDG